MPGFDGTGPAGRGPETGGGFGTCGAGRVGLRKLRGSRWYSGNMARRSYEMPGPEDEMAQLKTQMELLKAELAETERRMAELE